MKNNFSNMFFNIKINQWATHTWMCQGSRVGELGSEYQGRSRVSSLTQETGERIQFRSRIDLVPNLLEKVQDARWFLTHLPSFFLDLKKEEGYEQGS